MREERQGGSQNERQLKDALTVLGRAIRAIGLVLTFDNAYQQSQSSVVGVGDRACKVERREEHLEESSHV